MEIGNTQKDGYLKFSHQTEADIILEPRSKNLLTHEMFDKVLVNTDEPVSSSGFAVSGQEWICLTPEHVLELNLYPNYWLACTQTFKQSFHVAKETGGIGLCLIPENVDPNTLSDEPDYTDVFAREYKIRRGNYRPDGYYSMGTSGFNIQADQKYLGRALYYGVSDNADSSNQSPQISSVPSDKCRLWIHLGEDSANPGTFPEMTVTEPILCLADYGDSFEPPTSDLLFECHIVAGNLISALSSSSDQGVLYDPASCAEPERKTQSYAMKFSLRYPLPPGSYRIKKTYLSNDGVVPWLGLTQYDGQVEPTVVYKGVGEETSESYTSYFRIDCNTMVNNFYLSYAVSATTNPMGMGNWITSIFPIPNSNISQKQFYRKTYILRSSPTYNVPLEDVLVIPGDYYKKVAKVEETSQTSLQYMMINDQPYLKISTNSNSHPIIAVKTRLNTIAMCSKLESQTNINYNSIRSLSNRVETYHNSWQQTTQSLIQRHNELKDSYEQHVAEMNFDVQELIYELDALKRNWSILTGEEITSIIDGTASIPTEDRFVPYLIDANGDKVPECTKTDAIQFIFTGDLRSEDKDRGRIIISTANNTPTGIKWEVRSSSDNSIVYTEDDNKKSLVIYSDRYLGGSYYVRVYLTSDVDRTYDPSNYWDSYSFNIIGEAPVVVDYETCTTKIEPCTQTSEIRVVNGANGVDDPYFWVGVKFSAPATAVKVFLGTTLSSSGVWLTQHDINGENNRARFYGSKSGLFTRDPSVKNFVRVFVTNAADQTFDDTVYWDSEYINLEELLGGE